MSEAQLRQKEYYDKHRKPDPNLKSGDMVWFLTRNVRTTRPCKKLDYKKIRQLKILATIESSASKLDLPDTMKIHNIISPFWNYTKTTNYPHKDKNLLRLLLSKANPNMNLKK